MRRILSVLIVLLLITGLCTTAQPEVEKGGKAPLDYEKILNSVLEYLYTIANYVGQWIINLVNMIVGEDTIPANLGDPIGVLALLTGFLALTEIAKNLTWILVIAGWILIGVRLGMIVLSTPK